ncbi:TIGR02452 family protein [Flavobacterium pedocola]
MNKKDRIEIAEKTLEIIDKGYYLQQDVKKEISREIEQNIKETFTVLPESWDEILEKPISNYENITEITVTNATSIEALVKESGSKTAVLNFASAKNPGGGFLGGAVAQEESLARSSSLYASQLKDKTLYDTNRNQRSFLYTDTLIYSPKTVFWFDDCGNPFVEAVIADVITYPAPNKGAMLQHNRQDEMSQIEEVFKKRIDHVLHIANLEKVETLILGAWGCGVFRNNPSDVAEWFMEIISKKYSKAFKKIVFAVYDTSEQKKVYTAFEEKVVIFTA